jgi:hypothetical protein
VAAAANTHVERLQCYRGVSEDKAIGRFDEGLQCLYMEFTKGQHENWQTVQASLKGRDFFRPGPLMRALECERSCVLWIDELDKVDDGFEGTVLNIVNWGCNVIAPVIAVACLGVAGWHFKSGRGYMGWGVTSVALMVISGLGRMAEGFITQAQGIQ